MSKHNEADHPRDRIGRFVDKPEAAEYDDRLALPGAVAQRPEPAELTSPSGQRYRLVPNGPGSYVLEDEDFNLVRGYDDMDDFDQATAAALNDLADIERRRSTASMGDVTNVRVDSRTPWGPAQHVSHPAPGIAFAGTAGHGGFKLSPERNQMIPTALRNPSGWYEEDCESHIVGMYHPEAFPHWMGGDTDQVRAASEQQVRNWFPGGYEKATGNVIPLGESHEKDRIDWHARNRDSFVTQGVIAGDAHDMVVVTAVRSSDGTKMHLEMSRTAYEEARNTVPHGSYTPPPTFTPGDSRYTDVTFREQMAEEAARAARAAKPRYHGFSSAGLSPTQDKHLMKDLDTRWRDHQGNVRTLREIANESGFHRKTVHVEGGRRSYYLQVESTDQAGMASAYKVSKATWDAAEAPDSRTPAERALTDLHVAEDAYAKARDKTSWNTTRATFDEVRKAKAAVDKARDQWETARRAEADDQTM